MLKSNNRFQWLVRDMFMGFREKAFVVVREPKYVEETLGDIEEIIASALPENAVQYYQRKRRTECLNGYVCGVLSNQEE